MTQLPLFSVVIPTYQRNDLLAKCLDCLAPEDQTLPAQYEVIVTDDGVETTAEAMMRERYPWAKWIAGPRKGPAANRNNGAKYAQGEWLIFTDDDCLPSASWLSAFARAIASDIHVYEGKTTCEAGIHSPLEHAPINLTGGYLWSCNMMIKALLFQKLGGFDENFPYPHMEDVDLRERIKLAGYMWLFVEDALIDHPPKMLPFGERMGVLHEWELYYCHQKKKQQLSRIRFLSQIIIARCKSILNYSLCGDSLRAIISLIIELAYIFRHLSSWYQKYPIQKSLQDLKIHY